MKKLLHVIATPRGSESRTLKVSGAFLDTFRKSNPGCVIDELILSKETVPELTIKMVDGKYALLGGKDLSGELKDAWREIVAHIDRFLSADIILISTPMWNFGIPYMLKQYIDIIVQPKYLFRYTQKGVEGLAKGKKMVIIASRGGDYTSAEMKKMDFQEPYLRAVFGFVGITDITFITAQPMDMGEAIQTEKIKESKALAQETASVVKPGPS